MVGASFSVFGLVVVELQRGVRNDVDDAGGLAIDDCAGKLAAGDEFFCEQIVAERPIAGGQLLRRVRLIGLDDEDADAGAFAHGFEHIGRRQNVGAGGVLALDHLAVGYRHTNSADDLLGQLLVHGQRRRQHAGMRIGNLQIFEDALDLPILAPAAMQSVETGVWF